jgi:hypothetical protein
MPCCSTFFESPRKAARPCDPGHRTFARLRLPSICEAGTTPNRPHGPASRSQAPDVHPRRAPSSFLGRAQSALLPIIPHVLFVMVSREGLPERTTHVFRPARRVQNRRSFAFAEGRPRERSPSIAENRSPFVIAVTAPWCRFSPRVADNRQKAFDIFRMPRNFDEVEQDSMGFAPTGQKVDDRSSLERETNHE